MRWPGRWMQFSGSLTALVSAPIVEPTSRVGVLLLEAERYISSSSRPQLLLVLRVL